MKGAVPLALLLCGSFVVPASAHTTVSAGPYEIEVGWDVEPPVVGLKNGIVFSLTEAGESEGARSGVADGFRGLDATVKSGGLSKQLDVNAKPRPGDYISPIIPTRTGSMSVLVQGEIRGTPVDIDVPIEDVEGTAVLDFPPRTSAGSGDIASLKAAMADLQRELESSGGGAAEPAGPALDYAVFGMSLGAAGVILAVISMVRRR